MLGVARTPESVACAAGPTHVVSAGAEVGFASVDFGHKGNRPFSPPPETANDDQYHAPYSGYTGQHEGLIGTPVDGRVK
jgi:hypothetical protein